MPARLRVESGTSPNGSWAMVSSPPAPALRSMVVGYCGFREDSPKPVLRREVASPLVAVVIGFGDPHRLRIGPSATASDLTCFVGGVGQTPVLTEHRGVQRGIEVRLTPAAAYTLFGVPMSELADRVVDLEDLWGPRATRLRERLATAPDWPARFELLDRTLLGASEAGPAPDPGVLAAWRRLGRTGGAVRISELLLDTGWSRARIAARFRQQIGLTPKAVGRVIRFTRAAELLTRPCAGPLPSIALAAGYADQAHFNRDFRELAGCSPRQYLAARLPDLPGVGIGTHA